MAFRLFREESSCLSRMTSRTSLFTSLYMAFTKLNVAASNLVDEGLLLLDDLGMLSPSAAMDEFHQVFLLFSHCILPHVPKQRVRPVLVVSLAPIHLLLTIGLRLSRKGGLTIRAVQLRGPPQSYSGGAARGFTRACLVGCSVYCLIGEAR